MYEEKVDLKVEDGEENKEEDNDDVEVLDEEVDGLYGNEEDDRPKKTKEEIPNNLSFVKGVEDSDDLLTLNVNRETLQESKIIKVTSKKIVMTAIQMLRKLAEKDEYKKEKDGNIDNYTKEVEINEVTETYNDELVFDAANDTHPPQDAMPNSTAVTDGEGGDDDDVVADDGDNEDEADNTKGGGGGRGWEILLSNTGTTTTAKRT